MSDTPIDPNKSFESLERKIAPTDGAFAILALRGRTYDTLELAPATSFELHAISQKEALERPYGLADPQADSLYERGLGQRIVPIGVALTLTPEIERRPHEGTNHDSSNAILNRRLAHAPVHLYS